ncbi:MAG: UvrD-helicase domain-containing protein, partial [Candidatus Melainabacteria bacterium]|nr:UvrD-helicase domain-containing protein [Candidatus Melainabacteria bacterium]
MRFDILSRDVDVFAPHFLEASAGTGKTFAIEHLVTRLLLEGVAIEQVLIVTFTRAATRELKLRIRRNLARAKDQLETQTPTSDYITAICEKSEAAIKEALSRIEAALICYDQAQIYTLHGFCHRILKEFAFEAGIGLEVSDPDENDHLVQLEQIVKDHLKEGIQLPDYSPKQLQRLINDHKRDAKALVQKLTAMVSNGKAIAQIPSFEAQRTAVIHFLHSLPPISAELFIADVEALRPHYKGLKDEVVAEQSLSLGKILESKECSPEQFDHLLGLDLFLVKLQTDNLKVRAKLPA